MTTPVDMIRREWVRGMVQRTMFCPRTKEVLDVRTCVVLVDSDGDPRYVMSQTGWYDVALFPADVAKLTEVGLTVDESTVRTGFTPPLCQNATGGGGRCVRPTSHGGRHRDALGHEWGSA